MGVSGKTLGLSSPNKIDSIWAMAKDHKNKIGKKNVKSRGQNHWKKVEKSKKKNLSKDDS